MHSTNYKNNLYMYIYWNYNNLRSILLKNDLLKINYQHLQSDKKLTSNKYATTSISKTLTYRILIIYKENRTQFFTFCSHFDLIFFSCLHLFSVVHMYRFWLRQLSVLGNNIVPEVNLVYASFIVSIKMMGSSWLIMVLRTWQ